MNRAHTLLKEMGVKLPADAAGALESINPATGEILTRFPASTRTEYDARVRAAHDRFLEWRLRPAPVRGELVRRLGESLRKHKQALGELVSLETGKILSEGLGEVQEMIDICDFAVGLSRQIHGLTLPSERPGHRIQEQWHPLGPIGVVTAFNFPVAVWAWNASLAAVCGDVVLWKPSPLTPLCSLAVQALCNNIAAECDAAGVFSLVLGGAEPCEWICDDARLPLVSFTGSCAVGRKMSGRIAARLGRSILELGGNNAAIVLADADLDLTAKAIAFGAAATAGQRCTSTRRVFAQRQVAGALTEKLKSAFAKITVGDPLQQGTLMGPLIRPAAVERFQAALAAAKAQGGEVLFGGNGIDRPGNFVEPTLLRAASQADFPIACEETFAPILYLFEVESLEEAIAAHNAVPQGLSGSIFTDSHKAVELFLSAAGSDCGIANVNTSTNGAEIGGAFGGEKDTGGGREAGSDSWKAYMRRQTSTLNWSGDFPLAQGVEFG